MPIPIKHKNGSLLREVGGADLRGADLRGAYLSRADLTGADLTEAIGVIRISGTHHDLIAVAGTDLIHIGCYSLPVAEWHKTYKAVGRKKGYTSEQIDEYHARIEYATAWLERNSVKPNAKASAKVKV